MHLEQTSLKPIREKPFPAMQSSIHENYRADGPQPPSERSTGLVFAAVATIVAVIWRDSLPVLAGGSLVALLLAGISLFRPRTLRPVNLAWHKLALLLNAVVSPVVMLLIFCTTIVPFGLLMRLRSDPLRRKRPSGDTYWINRDTPPSPMTNQF